MRGQKSRKKQNNKKKQTYGAVGLLFGILFFCCLVWLAAYFIGLKRAEEEMDVILDSYVSAGGEPESGTNESGISADAVEDENAGETGSGEDLDSSEVSEETQEDLSSYGVDGRSIDWDSLQEEQNKDIYAWIVVPGTVIDYPVLQHPEEMDHYLEYNLDGSKGRPGCIYTQRMNSKDWSDRNTVLYGHNMRVGTMFAGLHDFEDADFFEENRYIHIYSEDGRILIYEIFAAYAFSDVHILLTYDFNTDSGYQKYLDTVRESAEKNGLFHQETEISVEDNIITLSTCIRGSSSQRYLVQGVLVAEGEQP